MPVRVSSRDESGRIVGPQASHFRKFFAEETSVVSIVGDGGVGKSTLACALGRWALADDADQRLAEHRMIPVFIEEETHDLVAAVMVRLRQMVGPDDVEKDVVLSLMEHSRLLVVVDALSERSAATQQHIEAIHGTVPVNALVVTSRKSHDFGAVAVAELRPEALNAETLVYFLTEYLRRTGADELFPGRQALRLGDRLMSVVEGRSKRLTITPLLVRLFIDNAVALRRQGAALDKLPLSVAETMLDYLRRVNPQDPDTGNCVPNDVMIQASRVLGRCSLEEDYVPRDFFRDAAEAELTAAAIRLNGVDVISRLVDNGILAQRERGGTRILRFNIDSLAEYLTALAWIDEFRSDRRAWTEALELTTVVDGYPESIRGFLVALEDCIETYREDFKIPELDFAWRADPD